MRKPDKLERQLKGVKKVYLDTACFIYHYGKHPLFQPASTEVLLLVEEGKLQGITSVLSVSEVLYRRLQKKPEEPLEYQRTLLGIQNLSLMFVDLDVAEKAAEIRLRYKLKTPDAIHYATALVHSCDVFVTNDKVFKKVKEIPVLLIKDLLPS
jgi:predicted nucleic acid-binding protein